VQKYFVFPACVPGHRHLLKKKVYRTVWNMKYPGILGHIKTKQRYEDLENVYDDAGNYLHRSIVCIYFSKGGTGEKENSLCTSKGLRIPDGHG